MKGASENAGECGIFASCSNSTQFEVSRPMLAVVHSATQSIVRIAASANRVANRAARQIWAFALLRRLEVPLMRYRGRQNVAVEQRSHLCMFGCESGSGGAVFDHTPDKARVGV